MANNSTAAAAGTSGVAGAAVGYLASPDGSIVVKWLSNYLGAIGFVSIVFSAVFVAGWYLTFRFFAHQKEVDEDRWNQRFQQLRGDTKESFQSSAQALDKVTQMIADKLKESK